MHDRSCTHSRDNMEPAEIAALADQYHESIRAHETDILALDVPKLRRPSHIPHGVVEACAETGCRICEPHTEATLTKLRVYVVKMYRLMCGREPCEKDYSANENTPHFNLLRADEWILDYGAAVEAAAKALGDKVPDYRERMERLRALAIYCDCVHTDKYIAMAAKYRAEVDRLDKERKQQVREPAETQEEATADLNRIRTALTSHWENGQRTMITDPDKMDQLLYCAVLFGMQVSDSFAPIRTDWWRASYLPDREVPGIGKPGNLIEITDDGDVWLRVPSCSKEPQNSVDVHVSKDSPMLAEILRAYKDTAIEKNDGFLFQPCSMACRKSRRPRATMALLRPGPCPHENACTRCKETFVCGKNGSRECACTKNGKRARPDCGSYCGPACGHYTNIMSRHKRVCSALGNVEEREQLATSMGTTKSQMERYGNGSGTA